MRIISCIFLILVPLVSKAQINFDRYFIDKVLRFDFMFAGNHEKTVVYPAGMKEEPFTEDQRLAYRSVRYGNFRYELFDSVTSRLIYSRGFCTLFRNGRPLRKQR